MCRIRTIAIIHVRTRADLRLSHNYKSISAEFTNAKPKETNKHTLAPTRAHTHTHTVENQKQQRHITLYRDVPELLLLPLPLDDGRRKMLENECDILFRFGSLRLNGSYDELGVSCGGVVADIFAVDV